MSTTAGPLQRILADVADWPERDLQLLAAAVALGSPTDLHAGAHAEPPVLEDGIPRAAGGLAAQARGSMLAALRDVGRLIGHELPAPGVL